MNWSKRQHVWGVGLFRRKNTRVGVKSIAKQTAESPSSTLDHTLINVASLSKSWQSPARTGYEIYHVENAQYMYSILLL